MFLATYCQVLLEKMSSYATPPSNRSRTPATPGHSAGCDLNRKPRCFKRFRVLLPWLGRTNGSENQAYRPRPTGGGDGGCLSKRVPFPSIQKNLRNGPPLLPRFLPPLQPNPVPVDSSRFVPPTSLHTRAVSRNFLLGTTRNAPRSPWLRRGATWRRQLTNNLFSASLARSITG